MNIECQNCGLKDDYRIEEKSTNKCAYCNGCDKYIKNIPYEVPKLYVGKYKGYPIDKIEDLQYLKWAVDTLKITNTVKAAINSQISHLEYLSK